MISNKQAVDCGLWAVGQSPESGLLVSGYSPQSTAISFTFQGSFL